MQAQIDFVQGKLDALERREWVKIAKRCRVPFSTFKKIGYKQTKNPRSDTLHKIATYFYEADKRGA